LIIGRLLANKGRSSNAFTALALNTVRASFRNRVALFFTLGLALLFMIIFGELFGGSNFKVNFGIVDNDNTKTSHAFISTLSSVNGVTTETNSESTERDRLKHNNVDMVVVIPQGFEAALAPGSSTHATVQTIASSLASANVSAGQQFLSGVLTGFIQYKTGSSPPVKLAQPQTESVNQVSGIDYFLPAMLAYIVLQSGINFVAITLVDLRARGVLRRLRATPATPFQVLSAQIVGGMLTVFLQILILIAAGKLLFQAHTYGSWLVLAVPLIIGTAAFVGIGFMLTSAARTSEAARGLASFVAFPMMFLSGVFFPVTDLPGWLQTLVHILPLTWLTDALHQVMNDGAGLSDIGVDCLVLAGWAVVMISVATWRFRWD
jgi:ABC-2 type transport system permease protein